MRKPLYLIIGLTAMLLAVAIPRISPMGRAVRDIEAAYRVAERPVLRPDSGVREAEQFLEGLQAIDTSKAPREVQEAFTKMLVAVEAHLHITRQSGGDTNVTHAANERVVAAKRELLKSFHQHDGTPH